MWQLVLALVFGSALCAQDATVPAAFEHFYNLEYNPALHDFQALAAREPGNADLHNHVAQTVLYREMFRSGALESELVTLNNPFLRREKMNVSAEDDALFEREIAAALELAGNKLKANPSDARALYTVGVSYGLRSNYKFLVRKAWLDALRDATAARKAHNRATEIDPSFTDARLVQGVYDYIVGSLPFTWKMLGFLAGFRGDRERGIATLNSVFAKGDLNKYDAAVILAGIYRRERRPQEAVPLLNQLIERYPRNFLFRLELVQMFADQGEKDKSLAVLDDVEKMRLRHVPGFEQLTEEKIRYNRGNLLFWYNDLDPALVELRAVTAKPDNVDLNTGVYAWLRIGQAYDMKGQRDQALMAYRETIRFAPNSDAAREAREYLGSRYKRATP